jgi:glycosyltransferase involved in cell wall biosynthesis
VKRVIGFFTDGPPFAGDALEHGAVGGAETAFIQVSRAVARLGHEVLAVNNCPEAARHHGVDYHPFRKSLQLLARKAFDVIVVSRFFGFFSLPLKSGLNVLWNHDTLDNPRGLRAVQDEIDLCLVLSQFHRDNYLTRLPQLDDRMIVTRNGLDLDLLEQASRGVRKKRGKLIYASRPERGLKLLLEEIWPRLSQTRDDLRLYVCGYKVPDNLMDKSLCSLYDYLTLLISKDPRIINLGSLAKKDYYRHLAEAEMMVYPCVFPEVSCLAVLEAQAAGTAVLTTDGFALSESAVQPEFKVPGKPLSRDYQRQFVDRALDMLERAEWRDELARMARSAVRARYSWDLVASEWMRVFDLALRAKETRPVFVEVSAREQPQGPTM